MLKGGPGPTKGDRSSEERVPSVGDGSGMDGAHANGSSGEGDRNRSTFIILLALIIVITNNENN